MGRILIFLKLVLLLDTVLSFSSFFSKLYKDSTVTASFSIIPRKIEVELSCVSF